MLFIAAMFWNSDTFMWEKFCTCRKNSSEACVTAENSKLTDNRIEAWVEIHCLCKFGRTSVEMVNDTLSMDIWSIPGELQRFSNSYVSRRVDGGCWTKDSASVSSIVQQKSSINISIWSSIRTKTPAYRLCKESDTKDAPIWKWERRRRQHNPCWPHAGSISPGFDFDFRCKTLKFLCFQRKIECTFVSATMCSS